MPFTPIQTFLGGLLLHISTSSLLTETGRVFGISSVVDGAFLGDRAPWRWAILAGLVSGPAVVAATGLSPALPDNGAALWAAAPVARLALAGALIGFGSKLGSGCTSGHFLCGVSRLSPRSLVATATFFSTAVAVAKLLPAAYLVDKLPAWEPVWPASSMIPALGLVVVLAIIAKNAVSNVLPKLVDSCSSSAPAEDAPSVPVSNGTAHSTPSSLSTSEPSPILTSIPYVLSGLTFSLGLIVSGMISPLKVTGFLRLPPPLDTWDPSLAFVVLGGVLPNMINWIALQRSTNGNPRPLFSWEKWQVPSRKDITPRLVAGALAFGLGWGLCGICPGPAIVRGGQLVVDAVAGKDVAQEAVGWAAYIVNMGLGIVAARAVERALA